jgi:Cu/Ag efflux protein CusF
VTATAVVEEIDHTTRMVTLRGPEGREISFRAGEQVRNLDQVEKGDTVEAVYYESVAVQVHKPGTAQPGVSAGQATGRAAPGESPAAMGVGSIVLTSTIEAIDPERKSVTLKDTDGSLVTVPVRNPANLEGVSVGDLVEITYTEAVAIAVEKPGAQ